LGDKNFRGRFVEGNWIPGMIDINTKEVHMAICPNNQQDAQTLYDLISKQVELTSTIHTDAWRSYNGLLASGFASHLTVNHCCTSST
jgi:Transposase and inactivated derivatives